ncbi:hypothetical protein DFJ73DRAFT_41875 [Zopfochytrium polystomum]|nr:hypothetical protein DFJ73DRAFT_41875 [Zopfochytrium polystomum]
MTRGSWTRGKILSLYRHKSPKSTSNPKSLTPSSDDDDADAKLLLLLVPLPAACSNLCRAHRGESNPAALTGSPAALPPPPRSTPTSGPSRAYGRPSTARRASRARGRLRSAGGVLAASPLVNAATAPEGRRRNDSPAASRDTLLSPPPPQGRFAPCLRAREVKLCRTAGGVPSGSSEVAAAEDVGRAESTGQSLAANASRNARASVLSGWKMGACGSKKGGGGDQREVSRAGVESVCGWLARCSSILGGDPTEVH